MRVVSLQPGAGQQLTQAQIAGARLHQHDQAMRLVAFRIVRDPQFAADDGFDALFARRLVELHHAEHIGKVGERQRRHAVRDRRGNGIVEADYAVAHRVLAVQAQVNERRRRHAGYFIPFDDCGQRNDFP